MRTAIVSFAISLGCLTGCSGASAEQNRYPDPALADSWERRDPDGSFYTRQDCQLVDEAWILPVTKPLRTAAIVELEDVDSIPLSDEEAARWAGIQYRSDIALAVQLMEESIVEYEEDKRSAYEDRVGSFSLRDEEILEQKRETVAQGLDRKVNPFLVRGVLKNEYTGSFDAALCPSGLSLSHFSLGRSEPPTKRVPVVVFLLREPEAVFPSWGMAE